SEVTRVAREVGTDGKLGGQADVRGVSGTWKDLTDSVNGMAANLTAQVRNIANVTTGVARGDLTQKITVDAKGEILELKNTVNTMVDQLNSFASEVTRVAREVGTDGKLGGQAEVKGVSGTWKDLTDNVNVMAANLTNQVRNIAKVVTAFANGDLKKKLTVEAKGEIAELTDTINEMIDTLATFADQVTTVARRVGVEGNLGAQANVPGTSGIWKDLTDNVNQLAANLTTQVRAIAEVATAVTKGDLTRRIQVEARGEVNELKNNINEMIRNLKDTTQKNAEQDWLKTNLARFARMLQGQKDLLTVSSTILSELAPLVNMQHGVIYGLETDEREGTSLKLLASFAHRGRDRVPNTFELGEGIIGQCALEKRKMLLRNLDGDYIRIRSGLGEMAPLNLIVLPIPFEGQVKGVVELASFESFTETHLTFLDQLSETIGIVLNTIESSMRTEGLLKKSQSLTMELQKINEELQEKARLLAEQKAEVDTKNLEIETAKKSLEDKAEQLALTSKYKSEFLSNMSHELRTPLNSLLILASQLIENPSGNLTAKEVEYARTIHASGNELLMLINDILDLSKIESGTVVLDIIETPFQEVCSAIDRTFRHLAEEKSLQFSIVMDPVLKGNIITDQMRLHQILKNLLSNAFKFTAGGEVSLAISPAEKGWSMDHPTLNSGVPVISFAVKDTGIGVPLEKQKIIFEAFQQVDGTTSRKYGGTGLGLAISREIAALLGGEIRLVESEPGKGTTFVLYLPQRYIRLQKDFEGEIALKSGSIQAWRTREIEYASDRHEKLMVQVDDEESLAADFNDDRGNIHQGDAVFLIIEDDRNFAEVLLEMVRLKEHKGLVALNGTSGLRLAHDFKPSAITLDVTLPDMDGWMVLERLKADPNTRHIPVSVISGDDVRVTSRKKGAFAFMKKPLTKSALDQLIDRMAGFVGRKERSILIVEDNRVTSDAAARLLEGPHQTLMTVSSAEEAFNMLQKQVFDCIILDLKLPGMSGLNFLESIQTHPVLREIPVIVYTGKDLTREEESAVQNHAQGVIIKGVSSPNRLLQETVLFLHRAIEDVPEPQRSTLEQMSLSDGVLRGRKILLVDDDVRNLFALTSVLERHDLKVITAENGRDALDILQREHDVEAVLMDIMMPEMDGYETIRKIRVQPQFKALPIIALTAKAMKGDREKCIEAGASDYIPKPVDTLQLTSLLRVLFHRNPMGAGSESEREHEGSAPIGR
ncbi:MAG: response regulator, partial [Desulfobacteraceae bacterium]